MAPKRRQISGSDARKRMRYVLNGMAFGEEAVSGEFMAPAVWPSFAHATALDYTARGGSPRRGFVGFMTNCIGLPTELDPTTAAMGKYDCKIFDVTEKIKYLFNKMPADGDSDRYNYAIEYLESVTTLPFIDIESYGIGPRAFQYTEGDGYYLSREYTSIDFGEVRNHYLTAKGKAHNFYYNGGHPCKFAGEVPQNCLVSLDAMILVFGNADPADAEVTNILSGMASILDDGSTSLGPRRARPTLSDISNRYVHFDHGGSITKIDNFGRKWFFTPLTNMAEGVPLWKLIASTFEGRPQHEEDGRRRVRALPRVITSVWRKDRWDRALADQHTRWIIWIQGTAPWGDGPAKVVKALEKALPNDVLEGVEFFANSWTGGSPGKLLSALSRGEHVPHVFWTKQRVEGRSEYDRDFKRLQSRYKGSNPLRQYIYDVEQPSDVNQLASDIMSWMEEKGEDNPEFTSVCRHNATFQRAEFVKDFGKIAGSMLSGMTPAPLPVQFSYQHDSGMLMRSKGAFPQLIAPSTIKAQLRKLGISSIKVDYNGSRSLTLDSWFGHLSQPVGSAPSNLSQRYVSYSHVLDYSMYKVSDEDGGAQDSNSDAPPIDYAWRPVEYGKAEKYAIRIGTYSQSGFYVMCEPTDKEALSLSPTYCNGLASVITSAHALYGVGANAQDRLFRDLYSLPKEEGEAKVDISGHIMHMCFAHTAHFLWCVDELLRNLISGESVYAAPFFEEKRGRYHGITEYKAGLAFLKVMLPYENHRIDYLYGMFEAIEGVLTI